MIWLFAIHAIAWLLFFAAMLGAWKLSVWVESRKQTTEDFSAVEDETMQLTFEDHAAAIAAKEKTLAAITVRHSSWFALAEKALLHVPHGWRGTFDVLHAHLVENLGLPESPDPGCWGALSRLLIKRGELVHTGVRLPMLAKKAKGRKTDEYVRVVLQEQAAA